MTYTTVPTVGHRYIIQYLKANSQYDVTCLCCKQNAVVSIETDLGSIFVLSTSMSVSCYIVSQAIEYSLQCIQSYTGYL